MTTLEIKPRLADKTARFNGTVAAGEHVAVTVKGGAEWLGEDGGEHLSLRVLDLATRWTLAVFPRPPETLEDGDEPDAWGVSGEDLLCNLNLNTTRMVAAARHMLRVPVLFVLGTKDDDNPATTRTLYFSDCHEVGHWPQRVGDDVPYDLDKWPKQIDEWTDLVDDFGNRLEEAETDISNAVSDVEEAIGSIDGKVESSVSSHLSGKADKVANATGGNLAALDANGNLADSGKKPADFADATEFATHKNNADIHFTSAERAKLNGIADGAQANVIETVKRNGVTLSVTNKTVNVQVPTSTSGLTNDGDGNSPFATTEALNRESSRAQNIESALGSSKADKSDTYTKEQTNALVSGAVSGVFAVVASLPAIGQANKIYLVPSEDGGPGNVRDEYMWVNGAWELVGSTQVDLSDYYDKAAADGRFVQKEAGKGLVAVDATLSVSGAAADAKAAGDALDGKLGKLVSKTHAELLALRTAGNLAPGQQYRITDYVATVANDADALSAYHPFDIIVTADDGRTLNERARAIRHEGDTYFASCDLAAWDVWYCLDNDTSRFAWADATNGKGVVYRLVDEFDNDVPYDFKGIRFKAYGDTDNVWRYTFDSGGASGNTDYSLAGLDNDVHDNSIAPWINAWKQILNRIVFKGAYCSSNTFDASCSSNTFGADCSSNTFGAYCSSNTFGADCSSNTFGAGCYFNTFGADCSSNTFGAGCYFNTFGAGCYFNTFGADCSSNTFGADCSSNTFGADCRFIKFGTASTTKSYCQYIRVASGNHHIYINPTGTTSSLAYYQNVEVKEGVNNAAAYKTISDPNAGQTFLTTYKPANSKEISA